MLARVHFCLPACQNPEGGASLTPEGSGSGPAVGSFRLGGVRVGALHS